MIDKLVNNIALVHTLKYTIRTKQILYADTPFFAGPVTL